ncbi:MAG: tetratricopeptide repeat protein [Gammaproteobacteria bacterium]|nr:tetratricopeptide repeat protein [Gammaproteobacteria bacterium]
MKASAAAQCDKAAAVSELEQAARRAPDNARYAYVYAVALNSTGQPGKALAVLRDADARHPNTPDILGTLVSFYREAGDTPAALNYARKLAAAMPDDPEVQRLVAELGGQWDSSAIMTYLRAKTPQELLAQMQGGDSGIYAIPWLLRDGVVLPAGDPLHQLQRGKFNRVPVILGTNRDEMKTMMIRNPDYTRLRFGVLPRVIDQALYDRVTGFGSQMWKAIGADEPASAMHQAGHRDVFVYRFDWDEVPANWLLDFRSLLGASHSFEIPFVFNDMDNEMTYLPFDLIDADNITGAAPWVGQCLPIGRGLRIPVTRAGAGLWTCPDGHAGRGEGEYLVFDTQADGGIRMHSGSRERVDVLRQLAGGRHRAWRPGSGMPCV